MNCETFLTAFFMEYHFYFKELVTNNVHFDLVIWQILFFKNRWFEFFTSRRTADNSQLLITKYNPLSENWNFGILKISQFSGLQYYISFKIYRKWLSYTYIFSNYFFILGDCKLLNIIPCAMINPCCLFILCIVVC